MTAAEPRERLVVLPGLNSKAWLSLWQRLSRRCSGIGFYLDGLLDAYREHSHQEAAAEEERWASGAPNQKAKARALAWNAGEAWPPGVLLFGKQSGTGKTTTAFEILLRHTDKREGVLHLEEEERFLPLSFTGIQFATEATSRAKKSELSEFIEELVDADILLLDDLDKRCNTEGKLSPSAQQALFDIVERRTTGEGLTIVTMNKVGQQFAAMFDGDVGPYLVRRLKERFHSVDFDQ